MGTKFANLHIKTVNVEEVVATLKEIVTKRSKNKPNLKLFLGDDYNPEFEHFLNEVEPSKNVYYIGSLREGWLSILNDWFAWGGVESFGEELSSRLKNTVFTISYFDDDVSEMNIFQEGKQATGHIWCTKGTQEGYGFEMKYGDINITSKLFEINDIDRLKIIFTLTDCEKAIDELESLILIPLWIHSDWFSDMNDEEIINKYKIHDLNN